MKRLLSAIALSAFALGAASAFATDMTSEERTDLRERAAALQAQRAQGGSQARSDVTLQRNGSDVRAKDNRGHVKQVKKSKKAAKKAKRSAKSKARSQNRV
jgi:hypothetical protein